MAILCCLVDQPYRDYAFVFIITEKKCIAFNGWSTNQGKLIKYDSTNHRMSNCMELTF